MDTFGLRIEFEEGHWRIRLPTRFHQHNASIAESTNVSVSVNDGDAVIDSGNSTTVNIKCKQFFAYFFL